MADVVSASRESFRQKQNIFLKFINDYTTKVVILFSNHSCSLKKFPSKTWTAGKILTSYRKDIWDICFAVF